MSPRRYRGRSGKARFVIPLAVLALALVLLMVNLITGKAKPAPVDTTPVETSGEAENTENTETGETGESGEAEQPPEEQPDPLVRIEIQGDVEQTGGIYRVGDTGYEMYTYVDSTAQKYASCVNTLADNLSGTANVYAMVIPLSSGITLPDDLYADSVFDDQKLAQNTILGYMNDKVIPVPLYDALMQHRGEYVYYRTDHHWSGLGAYYAYVEYCKAAGLTARELSSYQTVDFPGFLGSFYNDSGKNEQLGANPDTVTAYFPLGNAPMTVTDKNGNTTEYASPFYDETNAPAAFKYGAYIAGDNPFTEIHNESLTDGSACVVVKESFGNAYVPFMVDHYEHVYVIDYRYWKGSISDFVRSHGVKDVLLCNNLSAIRNNSLMGSLYSVL